MKKTGRALTYTEEMGNEICMKVAASSKSVVKLCRENPHWPCFQTIYEWRIKVPSFGDKYTQAKRDQIEALIDEILEISDDCSRDSITRIMPDGQEAEVCNSEWIARSRLRIDTRKWLASKLVPKTYGERREPESHADSNDFISRNRDSIKE